MEYNILIADDEKNIREGLGKALELDGYHVLMAADGEEAIRVVEENEVDLVISDLKMPALSSLPKQALLEMQSDQSRDFWIPFFLALKKWMNGRVLRLWI